MSDNKKKLKNEISELNEVFSEFQKFAENLDNQEINYHEIYIKNEMIKHFNRRILECNRICIKHPEIKQILYEEQKCINSCQRKFLEVESVVSKYFNELQVGKFDSPHINP
jgi:hypothetical protein